MLKTNMNYRYSTLEPMVEIMKNHKKGKDIKSTLEELLEHDDYKVQFDFFNNHPAGIAFTKEEFVDMFLNVEEYKPKDNTSLALIHRQKDLKWAFENLDAIEETIKMVNSISDQDFEAILDRVNFALRTPIDASEVQLVVAIGIGVTGAFNQGNINFFDLKKICADGLKQGFLNTLVHELHHLGYKEQFRIDYENVRPVDAFIHFFSGEGLAVKFGNNFEGVLTKKYYDLEHTTVKDSYNYYMKHSDRIIKQFIDDLKTLETGNMDDADRIFHENYWQRDVVVNGVLKPFYLKNPVAYYLGADIWGMIFDQLGKDKMFEYLECPDGLYGFLKCSIQKPQKEKNG